MTLDNSLLFSDDVNLTVTVDSSIIAISKTPAGGVWIGLYATQLATGTSPTLDAKVQYSDSSSFASGVEDGPAFEQLDETNTPYRRHLLVQSKRGFARIAYTLTGTSPVFNNVTSGIASGPLRDDPA